MHFSRCCNSEDDIGLSRHGCFSRAVWVVVRGSQPSKTRLANSPPSVRTRPLKWTVGLIVSRRAPFGRGYGSFSVEAHRMTGATGNLLDGQAIEVHPIRPQLLLFCGKCQTYLHYLTLFDNAFFILETNNGNCELCCPN